MEQMGEDYNGTPYLQPCNPHTPHHRGKDLAEIGITGKGTCFHDQLLGGAMVNNLVGGLKTILKNDGVRQWEG